MSAWVWTRPTARKRHRCQVCGRSILPAEDYDRMAGFDGGSAWTLKCCRHCYRVSQAYMRYTTEDEWVIDWVIEWLSDQHPALYATLRAGWRYPDGELVPLPFPHCCAACQVAIPDWRIWCQPCDVARVEGRIIQFAEVAAQFAEASV